MRAYTLFLVLAVWSLPQAAFAAESFPESIFKVGQLKPTDSQLKVKVGDPLPDFSLPTIDGGNVSLPDYKGKQHLVLSFIPAAWTPVCSGQWPGYNITQDIFEAHNTALVGISVDNIPSQFAWVHQMGGLWFPVASDFWPHGEFAQKLGILRSEGVSERALFVVDKKGIIRYIDVHNINERPDLGDLLKVIKAL
jgi:peroxiredoxin